MPASDSTTTPPPASPRDAATRGARALRVRLGGAFADGRRGVKILETIGFALLAPLVGALVSPDDPLGIGSGFAWAAALPVVLAARYGSVWGGACAALAAFACLVHADAYATRPLAPVALGIGTLVLALAVGEIGLAWRRRTARAEAESAYLRRRLQEFSNEHHVLKVSHGLLVESLAGRRMSLREALQRLERAVPETDAPDAAAFGADFAGNAELMATFAHFCSVQVAGLYAMRSPTVVDPVPVATHGAMGELPGFDPLLRAAIADGTMTSIRLDTPAADGAGHALLAVVPIVDSGGRLHGVLAVREMHFMAFQRENLNLMALLGAWLGDRFGRAGGFRAGGTGHFEDEIDAALRRVREHEVPATLVALRTVGESAAEVAAFVAGNIRSLDRAHVRGAADGGSTVAVLLPLSTASDAEDYASRVLSSLRERFGTDPRGLVAALRVRALCPDDTTARCLAFVDAVAGDGTGDGTGDGARPLRDAA